MKNIIAQYIGLSKQYIRTIIISSPKDRNCCMRTNGFSYIPQTGHEQLLLTHSAGVAPCGQSRTQVRLLKHTINTTSMFCHLSDAYRFFTEISFFISNILKAFRTKTSTAKTLKKVVTVIKDIVDTVKILKILEAKQTKRKVFLKMKINRHSHILFSLFALAKFLQGGACSFESEFTKYTFNKL